MKVADYKQLHVYQLAFETAMDHLHREQEISS